MVTGDGITTYTYTHDDGSFTIHVCYIGRSHDDRPTYLYSIFQSGDLLEGREDLRGPVLGDINARRALLAIVSFLTDKAERYDRSMRNSPPAYTDILHGGSSEWASNNRSALEALALELGTET